MRKHIHFARLVCLLWLVVTAGSLLSAAVGGRPAFAAADPADLALTKSVDQPAPDVGDVVNFTVTLTNNGPDPATGVTVQDLLPPGLPFFAATTSQGTYAPATGAWTVGTVTVGTPLTLTIAARVVSLAAETNTATVSHSDQPDPNTTNDSASVGIVPQQADLAVTKSVDDPTPNVGDTIHFTVTLTNNGPDTATGVALSDLLPAGLTFVSATPSEGTYSPVSGLWDVGVVAVGTPQTIVFTATVVAPGAQTNTATVADSLQFDSNPVNNSASATETPLLADLALAKVVDNPTPNVGSTIHFTVTLTNNGPNSATNVTVSDLLPAGLTFVSATPSQGTYNSTTGVWTVGTVTTSTPQTLVFTATVVAQTTQTNTATVSHSDQFDTNPANNSASATETPPSADLALTKVVDDPTPKVGDTIHFTITLIDNGPSTATGVTVADLLPPGLTLVSATPSQGTFDPVTGSWTVGTVSVGSPATIVIAAVVVSPVSRTNIAAVEHSDQIDLNPTNNLASATEAPPPADSPPSLPNTGAPPSRRLAPGG